MKDSRREELGDFLRARRAEITPQQVGLPGGRGRRVTGLRREEVAVLAAISTDYYARLEQGRIEASPSVIDALCRVLSLDEDQRGYLYELAAREDRRVPTRRSRTAVLPQLQRVLDEMAHAPAFVVGPRTEVVAWNRIGAALIADFAAVPVRDRYFLRMLFLDPSLRELYVNWESVARLSIAQTRMYSSRHPNDPDLTRLVGELSLADADFRRWWASHDVAVRDAGSKHLRHPLVGDLHLDWNGVTWGAAPDLQVVIWTAPPGSPSHDGLRLLSSLAADAASRFGRADVSSASPGGET